MAFLDKLRKQAPIVSANTYDAPPDNSEIPQYTMGMPPPLDYRSFVTPPLYPQDLEKLHKAYPLVFFLMENKVCTRKIELTCYGDQYPADILMQLQRRNLLPTDPQYAYRILYWPTQNGISTVERYDDSSPKQLWEFDPEPGRVLIIEQYRKRVQHIDYPVHTIYGCPTAALPQQENILQNSSVDTVAYD